MIKYYDWKKHYSNELKLSGDQNGLMCYTLENESGTGTVKSAEIFPGVQAVYNDLDLEYCASPVMPSDQIIQISYCYDGRYECDVNSRYCFSLNHGDLSVGTVGCEESYGGFPTGHYRGLTLYIETDVLKKNGTRCLKELEIDIETICATATRPSRLCVIRSDKRIDDIFWCMENCMSIYNHPMLRLKVFELLMVLSETEMRDSFYVPVYMSQKHALLAREVHKQITSDLSQRLTIRQLSIRLKASATDIKNSFKSVYGMPVRDYMKAYRMLKAQYMLRESQMNIAEIAETIGYLNPGKFTVAFKDFFGVTPSEYKKTGFVAEYNDARHLRS